MTSSPTPDSYIFRTSAEGAVRLSAMLSTWATLATVAPVGAGEAFVGLGVLGDTV